MSRYPAKVNKRFRQTLRVNPRPSKNEREQLAREIGLHLDLVNRKPSTQRHRFTNAQREVLLRHLSQDPYPSLPGETYQKLARELGITKNQVRIWFTNYRPSKASLKMQGELSLSPKQRRELMAHFRENFPYITRGQVVSLASRVNLTRDQVDYWFELERKARRNGTMTENDKVVNVTEGIVQIVNERPVKHWLEEMNSLSKQAGLVCKPIETTSSSEPQNFLIENEECGEIASESASQCRDKTRSHGNIVENQPEKVGNNEQDENSPNFDQDKEEESMIIIDEIEKDAALSEASKANEGDSPSINIVPLPPKSHVEHIERQDKVLQPSPSRPEECEWTTLFIGQLMQKLHLSNLEVQKQMRHEIVAMQCQIREEMHQNIEQLRHDFSHHSQASADTMRTEMLPAMMQILETCNNLSQTCCNVSRMMFGDLDPKPIQHATSSNSSLISHHPLSD